MNYKHGRFKRLFAMFLVLVMLATSGNGYSMQVWAQEARRDRTEREAVNRDRNDAGRHGPPRDNGGAAPETEAETQADTAQTETGSLQADHGSVGDTGEESVQDKGQDGSQKKAKGQLRQPRRPPPGNAAPESLQLSSLQR